MAEMIVIDIWGGENSLDHLARFMRPLEEAITIARRELTQGFLVNLRLEANFGEGEDFDLREAANG